jgi:hypothetical protein
MLANGSQYKPSIPGREADYNRGEHFPKSKILWGFKAMRGIAILLALLCSAVSLIAEEPVPLKPVVVYVEGNSSIIPKFISVCREMGPERGIDFRFVDKPEDKYDFRVVLNAEGEGMFHYAQGNILVMSPEAKVIFSVTRGNRTTANGTTNALTKEFVKVLARNLGTHK